jgi:hypothetical protein
MTNITPEFAMTSLRQRLPNRRAAESFDLNFAGLHYTVTVGHSTDGRVSERFIANHKRGNAADVAARDAGILISLLLQHGCDLTMIAHAISRNSDGTASGVVGAVLDAIVST